MELEKLKNMNTTALAFLGDSIYTTYVRSKLLENSIDMHVKSLHIKSTKYVSAASQAIALKWLWEERILTEEEYKISRRAYNRPIATKAKNAHPLDYKKSTALEALIGYLYYADRDRMSLLLDKIYEKLNRREYE